MAIQQLADLDFNNAARVRNLPAPANPDEPVRLQDLNNYAEGLAWKDSARVATQGNVNLASPGASLDGVAMAVNDRVLVRAQDTGADNGLYIWNGAAVPMTRAPDASTASELESATLTVEEGTNAGVTYRQTAVNFTLGVGAVSFTAFGTSAPQASASASGIVELADQAETDAGVDTQRAVTPATLAASPHAAKRVDATIGDGSATTFTVTHNLNSRDVTVQVYRTSGTYDQVLCDVKRPTLNTVELTFAVAPAAGQFRVLVRR